jgi:DNA-binding XRE family transcriptional regulator
MVKRKRNKTNGDMPVQMITGRDGKPAFAVMPFEVFTMLLASACEGAKETSNETNRPLHLKRWTQDELEQLLSKNWETETLRPPVINSILTNLGRIYDWNIDDSAVRPSDDEGVAVYDDAKAREEESFPLEIADRMIGGENTIKVFREHRGLTQKQLAKKADTSAAYLSQIETGRRTGSIKLLRRLAGALKVEVEDLI